MKVLHLLYSGLGGHGSVFFSLVKADSEHFFEYEAVFNGIEDIREEYIKRCVEKNIPFIFIKKQPGKHLSFYSRIFNAIRMAKPDILFLHGSMSVPAAIAAKVLQGKKSKIIVRQTQAFHLTTNSERMALKVSMLLADRVVFLSHDYRTAVAESLGSFYQPKKVAVIPNGMDLSFFKPILDKPKREKLVLGMQSRLVAIKDHITLFKAIGILISRYPDMDLHLLIAGDGEYRFFLQEVVEKARLTKNISFMGLKNEDELPEFLHSLDIYIHASLGETMSTAIMQAMACGLPIIASDVDGINNMISHGQTGILVPVKNEFAMADAIYDLSVDEEMQKKLSEKARLYAVEHFSNGRMFESYKRIFL